MGNGPTRGDVVGSDTSGLCMVGVSEESGLREFWSELGRGDALLVLNEAVGSGTRLLPVVESPVSEEEVRLDRLPPRELESVLVRGRELPRVFKGTRGDRFCMPEEVGDGETIGGIDYVREWEIDEARAK